MKIAQICQGDTLANLDQEGPNVKKQQKYVMQTVKHAWAKIRVLAPGLWHSYKFTRFTIRFFVAKCFAIIHHPVTYGHDNNMSCTFLRLCKRFARWSELSNLLEIPPQTCKL